MTSNHTVVFTTRGKVWCEVVFSCDEFDSIVLAADLMKQTFQEFIIDAMERGLKGTDKSMSSKLDQVEEIYNDDFSHKEFSHAEVGLNLNGDIFSASGFARRHPTDAGDTSIGLMLAYGRAFEALGKKLQKRANGLVKHRDDMRVYRQEQQDKRQETPTKKKAASKKAAKK